MLTNVKEFSDEWLENVGDVVRSKVNLISSVEAMIWLR